ncbi:hypothetical protein G4B88_004670 [Cannabis sativa]|uniref:Uncharacterized protein n=1 Tax=Cannabis sativa TaxID=3483 RepID=A0A7J6FYX3_CANSA|nr:hypothetical protein G4B88_004670 [Cannabis sativa]
MIFFSSEQNHQMADAVVSFVIERLGDLVISEAQFLGGVEAQVGNAQIKLQCMSAFLKDADVWVRNGDERVRLLVVQIREKSLDLEDVIETYVLKVTLRRNEGLLKRCICIFRKGIDVHKVGSEIERISSNIDTWTSQLEALGVQRSIHNAAEASSSYVQRQRQLRQAYSYVEDNVVVGFGKDIEDLVALLTEKEYPHNHKVISVYGMGGLGKTTLARKVYQHPQVKTHFDCYAWASISQQCNRREVLEGILFAFTSPTDPQRDHIKKLNDDELGRELHNFQKQKKCLVVLDDIWTTATWDLLKHAFPTTQEGTHSKILLTTRNKDVAVHADQHGFIHEPHFLNEEESLELFHKKLPNSNDDEERKKELAVEMVRRCSGLPLAIIVLAGLLSKKHTLYEWEQMKANVIHCIGQGDQQHEGDSKYRSVLWVLGLSYSELPSHLKPCFLYLAHYSEDVTIRMKDFCRVLIAEGFISLRRGSVETLEEVAYDWLCELVERSMIQVKEMSSTGRIKSFCIHDLMRDLCVSRAQEENFLHFIDCQNKGEEPIIKNARRVSIFDNESINADDFIHMVRKLDGSLRCFTMQDGRVVYQERVLSHVCNHFLMLRVLIIDGMLSNEFILPKEIGNLIHLRLLSIPYWPIRKIPSSFGNLRCLQTLRVRKESDIIIPNSMCKLEQLRHLYFYNPVGGVELGKFLRSTRSRSLQTLVGVGTKNLLMSDLLRFGSLKKLAIGVDGNFNKFLHNPQNLTFTRLFSLQVGNFIGNKIDIVPLILSCPQMYKLRVISPIVSLPKVNQFSSNLIKLQLANLYLEDDPMPTLEKLPKLSVLILGFNSYIGEEMVCSRRGFPQLESLKFDFLTGLKEWKVAENALAKLGYLGIRGCMRLRRVPDGLRKIGTLNEMVMDHMPMKFKERMEEGGDDFDQVKLVQSRVFINCDQGIFLIIHLSCVISLLIYSCIFCIGILL